jgi:hypothetical protein
MFRDVVYVFLFQYKIKQMNWNQKGYPLPTLIIVFFLNNNFIMYIKGNCLYRNIVNMISN